MSPKIRVASPSDRSWHDLAKREQHWLLWFGACAPIHILAYGHLEDALESAAEYLDAKGLKGYFTDPEYPENMAELFKEDPSGAYAVQEECEVDLTCTESGWIPSWEWGITIESPSREDLIKFHHAS